MLSGDKMLLVGDIGPAAGTPVFLFALLTAAYLPSFLLQREASFMVAARFSCFQSLASI